MTNNPLHTMHRRQLTEMQNDLNLIAKGYHGAFGETLTKFIPLNENVKRNVSSASYFVKLALDSLEMLQAEWDAYEPESEMKENGE